MNSVDAFFRDYFGLALPDIRITDVVEVIIIAFFVYQVLKWIKNTRAWMLLRGILVVVIFFIIAAILQMNTILWLGEKLISVAVIALLVVFQPELRYALEHLGRGGIFSRLLSPFVGRNSESRFSDKTLNDINISCQDMSRVKTGALIVVENQVGLDEYIRTGITLDSLVSRQLINNIFEKNTPLHDGAIIIRGDRIVAATCYLPLSSSFYINKDLGTRHRSALGLSEVSDAMIIVVSEETGSISYAMGGKLFYNVEEEVLKEALKKLQSRIQARPASKARGKGDEDGNA